MHGLNCLCQFCCANRLQPQMPMGDPSLYQRLLNDGLRPSKGDSRDMTAADLGIVDQNLDDKIGMEPNPLDGTRLWNNS